MRTERRRQNREREAVEMNALHENPDEALAQVAPILDEAINQLNVPDRDAIVLRFFERCDFRAIGDALGSNEDAAQKRVTRALEKLRHLLVRRGVTLSGTALALALGSQAASAAPAGLAFAVSATALTTAAHTGSGLTLTTLKIMAMTKLKMMAIAAISTLVLAAGTTYYVMNHEKDYAADYTPPANPNMQKILQEARADTTAGRYKESLAKQVWFQENALKYEPAMAGVRSSFALSYFGELAEKYPPAMKKLRSMQATAEETVRDKNADSAARRTAFAEFTSINRAFKEENKTVECFVWFDAHDPALAKSVFAFADQPLIEAKEYKLYGRYVDPEGSYKQTVQIYHATRKSLQSSPIKQAQEFPQKSFSNKVATLVALLAINDRKEDADRIAAKAAQEWNDPAFLAQLDEAKSGVVPEPWP
jgi:hypothetical protein